MSPLRAFERLEARDCPADLHGYGFGLSQASAQPGQSMTASWSVANNDWDTIATDFDVVIYLSRDAVFGPGDLELARRTLPPGFPGFYAIPPQYDAVSLPASSHPVWNGSGTYYIGMRVDDTNRVWEWNESNNSSTGIGYDFAPIDITFIGGGGENPGPITELPETGYKAGSVLRSLGLLLVEDLRLASKSDMQMRIALNGVLKLPVTALDLNGAVYDWSIINETLRPLTVGTAKSVKIAGMTLDREGLELLERSLAYLLDLAPPGGSQSMSGLSSGSWMSAQSFSGGALAGDKPALTLADCKEMRDDAMYEWKKNDAVKKRGEEIAQFFTSNPKVAAAVGQIFEGYSMAYRARNVLARLANADACLDAVKSEQDRAQLEKQLNDLQNSDLLERLDITDRPGIFNRAHIRFKKIIDKQNEVIHKFEDQIFNLEKWQRNNYLKDQWKGSYNTPNPFGGMDDGNINFSFRPAANGATATGSLSFPFKVWNANGQVIATRTTSATFTGALDDFGVFRGEATFTVPGVGRQKVNVSWQMLADGTLTGSLYENSLTSFTIRPVKEKAPPPFLA